MPWILKSICITFDPETERKKMLTFQRDFPEYTKFRKIHGLGISFIKTEQKFIKEIRKRESKNR